MSEAHSHSTSVNQPTSSPAPDKSSRPQANGACPGRLDSTDLLRGQKTVEISHNGSTYRLQATRLGKLILTK